MRQFYFYIFFHFKATNSPIFRLVLLLANMSGHPSARKNGSKLGHHSMTSVWQPVAVRRPWKRPTQQKVAPYGAQGGSHTQSPSSHHEGLSICCKSLSNITYLKSNESLSESRKLCSHLHFKWCLWTSNQYSSGVLQKHFFVSSGYSHRVEQFVIVYKDQWEPWGKKVKMRQPITMKQEFSQRNNRQNFF
jgi:hypothetical protein